MSEPPDLSLNIKSALGRFREKILDMFAFVKGNIRILLICYMIWSFSMFMVMPFFPLYVLELGGTPETIGAINALGAFAGLIVYPIGGYLADSRGRVKIIGTLTYFFALSNIFYIFAPSWTLLAIGWFLQRFFEMYLPAINALMADSLPPKQRGIGFATTMAIPSAVGMVSPYLGGYLIDLLGLGFAMRILYTITLGSGLVVATLRFKFLEETLRESRSAIPLGKVLLLFKTSYKSLWEALKWMPTSLRSMAVIAVITAFSNSIAVSFWVVYAVQIIGLSSSQWGLTILITGVLRLVLVIPAGMFVDRFGTKKVIVMGAIASIAPAFLFPYSTTFLHVVVLLLVLSVANTFLMPACQSFVANITPRDKRARIIAAFGPGSGALTTNVGGVGGGIGFVLNAPRLVGSALSGVIYTLNPIFPWYFLATGLTLGSILSFLLIHEPKRLEI